MVESIAADNPLFNRLDFDEHVGFYHGVTHFVDNKHDVLLQH